MIRTNPREARVSEVVQRMLLVHTLPDSMIDHFLGFQERGNRSEFERNIRLDDESDTVVRFLA